MKTLIKFFLLVLVFSSCQKSESDVELDKEVRLPLNLITNFGLTVDGYIWVDTIWSNPYEKYWKNLIGFDKLNYSKLTSIVISVPMYSAVSDKKCYVDLFNLTDSVSIEGSLIETNSAKMIIVNSQNLLNSLPNKPIDLALRIKSSEKVYNAYNYVGVGMNANLIISR